MKILLPGAAIGLLGGGENSRMFARAASRMGYGVRIYGPPAEPWEDLDRIREFAAAVDVVTVVSDGVPAIALLAAGLRVNEAVENAAVENGAGAKPAAVVVAEFSVVAARGAGNGFVSYAPVAVDRIDGVPDIARSPAPVGGRTAKRAAGMVRDVLEDLDLIGIACVDFALTGAGDLVVRDVTPYPHTAGLLTIEACLTSQFEQHLRAVCGLPLGSTGMLRPAATAMVKRTENEPDWAAAFTLPEVKVHVYGPHDGHLTATATSATLAKQIVRTARAGLFPK